MREQDDEAVTARLRAVCEVRGHAAASPFPSGMPPPSPPVDRSSDAVPAPPDVFADRSPLAWTDLVPSWPDDVELDEPGPPRGPSGAARGLPDGLPGAARGLPGAARGLPGALGLPPDPLRSPPDPLGLPPDPLRLPPDPLGLPPDLPSSAAPIDPSAWGGVRPAWTAEEDEPDPAVAVFGRDGPGGSDQDGLDAFDRGRLGAFDRGRLGAFDRGRLGAFDRGRLGALDPGRRGAKALAAVAVAVVVIAAFFAWRARPRVDPVAPPLVSAATADRQPSAAPSAGAEVVVSVAGKVGKPGLVRLPPGSRVADALTAAGGARPGVDVAMLNVARRVVDGELILVGVTPAPGTVAAGPGPPPAAGGAPGGPVNLNAATLADLDGLPGVGPVLAQRILDTRDAQGGFRAVSDLRTVQGIGDARYEQLKDLVTI